MSGYFEEEPEFDAKDIILFILFFLVVGFGIYFAVKEEQRMDNLDLMAVKKYPQCATARFPRECGKLLDRVK